jgi:WD40 repeat protein
VIRLWNLETGEHRDLTDHTKVITRLVWFPDGRLFSGSLDGTVRIWDVAAGTARVIRPPGRNVFGLAVSPDGETVATTGPDSAIRLWSTRTLAAGRVLLGHAGVVYAVGFSPDGKSLASGSGDHTIRLWDFASGLSQTLVRYRESSVDIGFSRDGSRITTASDERAVHVIDVVAPREPAQLATWVSRLTDATISGQDTLAAK